MIKKIISMSTLTWRADVNKVILIGNLGRIQNRYMPSGGSCANPTLATSKAAINKPRKQKETEGTVALFGTS